LDRVHKAKIILDRYMEGLSIDEAILEAENKL
jgi:hypothetical protein